MVPALSVVVSYTADGFTSAFSYNRRVYLPSDLLVYTQTGDDAPVQITTGFSTVVATDCESATVTFADKPVVGTKVYLYRATVHTQDIDISNTEFVPPSTVEKQLDRQVMMIQEMQEQVGRAWKSALDGGDGLVMPAPGAGTLLGWNDDGTAIENKAVVSPSEALPAAALSYLVRNSANTAFVSKTAAEVWSDLSDTRAFDQAATDQIKPSLGARYHRIADMIRLGGEAIKNNGEQGADGVGGFLWDDTGGTTTTAWMEAKTILSVGGLYNKNGSVAITAAIKGPGLGSISTIVHQVDDDATPTTGTAAWAHYIEGRRNRLYGTTYGVELDIINLLVSPATRPFNSFGNFSSLAGGAGTTMGIDLACGGGGTLVGTVYDCDVALVISNNGAKFMSGLVFRSNALTADETTGRMHAVGMSYNQAIEWIDFTNIEISASLSSLITTSDNKQELQFSNAGLTHLNSAGKALFRLGTSATAVNGLVFTPANTGGGPRLDPLGDDTNISGVLRGKGTGGWIIQDGSANTVIRVDGVKKLGLFGVTPVVQPAVTGALSSITDTNTVAVLTSILAALSGVGVCINSTT